MQSINANSETFILLILPSLIKIFYLKNSLTKRLGLFGWLVWFYF